MNVVRVLITSLVVAMLVVAGRGASQARGWQYTTLDDPHANMTVLGMGGAASGSEALGVNAQGDVVGWYAIPGGTTRGYLLHKGRWTTLDDPHAGTFYRGLGSQTQAQGINAQEDVVGWYRDRKGFPHGFLLR